MLGEFDNSLIAQEKARIHNYPHPNVGVMPTYLCGGKCVDCLAGVDKPEKIMVASMMPSQTVDLIISQLTNLPERFNARLHITGGEPSLHPNFIDICQKFADAGFDVKISTNLEFVDPKQPFEIQPKLLSLFNLIRRSNVSVKLPLDEMHANSFPKLPEIMRRLNEYLKENNFQYGDDYVYAVIANDLMGIARAARRYGYEVDEKSALGLIRDWRPYYQNNTQISEVVSFLQVGPDGLVFQNYSQMLAKSPLGTVDNLGNFVQLMTKKIEQGKGKVLKHKDVNADWAQQAHDLVNIFRSL